MRKMGGGGQWCWWWQKNNHQKESEEEEERNHVIQNCRTGRNRQRKLESKKKEDARSVTQVVFSSQFLVSSSHCVSISAASKEEAPTQTERVLNNEKR